MKQLVWLLCPFAFCTSGFGQELLDSILLLNGKVISGEISGFGEVKNDSVIFYTDTKGKTGEVANYRVFSYYKDRTEKEIYRKDEFSGNYLSVQETKAVTYGSYDARQTFKPHVALWTGFALGLGASLTDTYLSKKEAANANTVNPLTPGFFQRSPSWFPFIIPPVLTVSWAFPTFKLKKKKIIHGNYYNDENFYRGYHRIAKQKRMLSGLSGSIAGVAVGMGLYYMLN